MKTFECSDCCSKRNSYVIAGPGSLDLFGPGLILKMPPCLRRSDNFLYLIDIL
jgi:hypothetical protein